MAVIGFLDAVNTVLCTDRGLCNLCPVLMYIGTLASSLEILAPSILVYCLFGFVDTRCLNVLVAPR